MAVQDGDERLEFAGAEPGLEPLDGLRRKRNLRHEHDGALALFECVGDGLKINLGLAAAGDAMEKKCSRRSIVGGTGVAPVKFGVAPNFVMSRTIWVGGR